jgi:acetyl coenzyme A synthetase (ADP forming)-like protein
MRAHDASGTVLGMTATLPEPVRDVILRSGLTLRLRQPTREDADALLDFYRTLSEQSLYLRFHGFPSLAPELVAPLLDPDWSERGALIGTLGEGDEERVVAVANFVRLRDPSSAEVAFAVADELQGQGVGTRLLEQLAECAAGTGIETFVAEVMGSNRPMLQVFSDAGFAISRTVEQGAVEVRLSIAPTGEYRERVDQRDHEAVRASLRPFFEPRSVAVIGASRRRGSIGGELFRNILDADFAGAAYPVNKAGEPVAGVKTYTSIADIPDEIDLAVICLPGEHVLPAADEALAKGVRALCVISAGFAETGAEGIRRQEELLRMVRAHGARLIGPNCLGIAVSSCRLNATFGTRPLPAGNVGFSSQSGALGLALVEAADSRGLGLSAFVSVGNKADVSSNDLLEYWEDDPDTELLLLYLESFGNPRKFARLARRVARTKPILAMKGGRTRAGAKAAGSHTAALAGSEEAVDAVFRHAGVMRADTLEELVDVAALLSTQPLPRGRRVALLTNAGGLGILAADACEAAGLEPAPLSEETRTAISALLPREASLANPVDMLGSATEETFEAVLPHVLADPGIDSVIVLFVPPVVAEAEAVAEAVVRAVESSEEKKPVLGVFVSHRGTPSALLAGDRRVAAFLYPESAARALGRAAERAEWLRRPGGVVPQLEDIDERAAAELIREALAGSTDVWLDPARVRALLASYGVPFVGERLAETADEAVAAAAELGYPVVVKTAAAGVHKSDQGLLALNLADEQAVREAVDRIGTPVVVQQMVVGGAELLAGVIEDPVFGPLVAFGPGGVFAELIGDAQFRLAPLTDVDADELVTTGKVGKLVAGYRGSPASDAAALADLLLRLSQLADNHPEIAELDLNPVVGLPDGCVAVDARIRLRPAEPSRRAKTW